MNEKTTAIDNLIEFFAMQWVDVLAALLTPTIAIIALFIAYNQLRVNRQNLREKLFNRRIQVYEEVTQILSLVLASGNAKVKDGELPLEYRLAKAWRDSRFLFASDVADYIDGLRKKVIELQMYENLMEKQDDEYGSHVMNRHERFKWLSKQYDPLFRVFEPYLRFKN